MLVNFAVKLDYQAASACDAYTRTVDVNKVMSCHIASSLRDGWLQEWTSAAQLLQSRTAFIRSVPVSPVHVRIVLYCILYLSISIALLAACAFQKRSRPQQLTLSRSLHAEALQATVSEGLAQGPYLAARAGFEPTKGIVSTNAPPSPTNPLNGF